MNVFKFYYDYQGWEVVKKKNYSFTTINGSCVIFCYENIIVGLKGGF